MHKQCFFQTPSNCPGQKSVSTCPRRNFMGGSYPGVIVQGELFRKEFPWSKSQGCNCPRGNFIGGNYPKGSCPGGNILITFISLGAITWKPITWRPLSRGNFPDHNCLGLIISSWLFYGAIVWTLIVQGLIT